MERNADFARLALSALSLATRRAASACRLERLHLGDRDLHVVEDQVVAEQKWIATQRPEQGHSDPGFRVDWSRDRWGALDVFEPDFERPQHVLMHARGPQLGGVDVPLDGTDDAAGLGHATSSLQ